MCHVNANAPALKTCRRRYGGVALVKLLDKQCSQLVETILWLHRDIEVLLLWLFCDVKQAISSAAGNTNQSPFRALCHSAGSSS